MEAARLDNKEMITLLLDNAADPNAINSVSFCNMYIYYVEEGVWYLED